MILCTNLQPMRRAILNHEQFQVHMIVDSVAWMSAGKISKADFNTGFRRIVSSDFPVDAINGVFDELDPDRYGWGRILRRSTQGKRARSKRSTGFEYLIYPRDQYGTRHDGECMTSHNSPPPNLRPFSRHPDPNAREAHTPRSAPTLGRSGTVEFKELQGALRKHSTKVFTPTPPPPKKNLKQTLTKAMATEKKKPLAGIALLVSKVRVDDPVPPAILSHLTSENFVPPRRIVPRPLVVDHALD